MSEAEEEDKRKGDWETERMAWMRGMMKAAGEIAEEQVVVRRALRGLAFEGVWPDGRAVKRGSVRMAAMKMMTSGVPEKVLEKMMGVGETAEKRTMTVHLVLDAKVDRIEGEMPKLIEQAREEDAGE